MVVLVVLVVPGGGATSGPGGGTKYSMYCLTSILLPHQAGGSQAKILPGFCSLFV